MNCLVSFSLENMVRSAKVLIFSWIPVGWTNITSVYSISFGVRPIILGTAPDQFEPLQYNLKIHYLECNGQQENKLMVESLMIKVLPILMFFVLEHFLL
jgi:hypothetical protein